MKKAKALAQEAEKLVSRLKETQELIKEAQQEEQERLQSVTGQIETICKDNDVFCGMILTVDDLAAIIKLAVDSKQNLKIPFRIYLNED